MRQLKLRSTTVLRVCASAQQGGHGTRSCWHLSCMKQVSTEAGPYADTAKAGRWEGCAWGLMDGKQWQQKRKLSLVSGSCQRLNYRTLGSLNTQSCSLWLLEARSLK